LYIILIGKIADICDSATIIIPDQEY
jgi:hypothetical protein